MDEPRGWRAYFCTHPTARVADTLGLVADRFSHADKPRAWTREILGETIRAALRAGADEQEIHATAERLLDLAA